MTDITSYERFEVIGCIGSELNCNRADLQTDLQKVGLTLVAEQDSGGEDDAYWYVAQYVSD